MRPRKPVETPECCSVRRRERVLVDSHELYNAWRDYVTYGYEIRHVCAFIRSFESYLRQSRVNEVKISMRVRLGFPYEFMDFFLPTSKHVRIVSSL